MDGTFNEEDESGYMPFNGTHAPAAVNYWADNTNSHEQIGDRSQNVELIHPQPVFPNFQVSSPYTFIPYPLDRSPFSLVNSISPLNFSTASISTINPTVWSSTTDVEPVESHYSQFDLSITTTFLENLTSSMAWPLGGDHALNDGDFHRLEHISIESLLSNGSLPVASVTDVHMPTRTGVLMISNIPYTVTRQEVSTFLGRGNRTMPSRQGPTIHIIMERSTGKTMDCFVEYPSEKDAKDIVDRINRNYDFGSAPRMGSRHVDVELSSPAKMMKAIFPLAKCIAWVNAKPVRLENTDEWSTGFNGFLTDEELFCLTRHAEQPHRSAFANKVPQRCYESLITTIWKFPWYATQLYTVYHRNKLFHTLCFMIKLLVERIQKQNTVGLDHRLLNELVQTGIACPAFNPRMKYCFAWYSRNETIIRSLDHDWCLYFPFDTLNYVPGRTSIEIQFYAYIMAHGCVSIPEKDGLINKHHHPGLLRIYGRNFFEWSDEEANNKVFQDAILHEARIYRQFLITGFQHMHGRQSSISTIGTAPRSPPNTDNQSVDSERTVIAPVSKKDKSVPATHRKSAKLSTRTSHNPQDFVRNWIFPSGLPVTGKADPNSNIPDTSTSTSRPSDEPVMPYRPPHVRHGAAANNNRQQSGGLLRQIHPPKASNLSHGLVPTYRAPHSTAQNVRSSSYPHNQTPGMGHANPRSRSDACNEVSNIPSTIFEGFRTSLDPRPVPK